MHPFLRELIDLDLPSGDFAVFGSGVLLLRGWIDDVGDLDVLARHGAWDKAVVRGIVEPMPDGGVTLRVGEGLHILPKWPLGPANLGAMIDTAEQVAGFPCVQLEYIAAYMRLLDRPKDRERLAVIEAHQ